MDNKVVLMQAKVRLWEGICLPLTAQYVDVISERERANIHQN